MKKILFMISALAIATLSMNVSSVSAQDCGCDAGCCDVGSPAAKGHSLYAHSHHGRQATKTHRWNQAQMDVHPWHGDYSYWRFGTPTALVVPPTAGFQTNYSWGVGRTTSTPIYHQFGSGDAGIIGGGEGMFSPTPYWPSNTNQFGVYPVRGPWGRR